MSQFMDIFNEIVGWVSICLWTTGFFLKSWVIYLTKTGDGVALDYLFMNWTAFYFYLSFNIYGKFFQNNEDIHMADFLFTCFSWFMTNFEILQIYYYPKKHNKFRILPATLTILCWISVLFICIFCKVSFAFEYMGYMKIFLTNARY